MKLYSGPVSVFGAKAEIAAIEKGIDVEIAHVPFTFKTYYHPKPDVDLAHFKKWRSGRRLAPCSAKWRIC